MPGLWSAPAVALALGRAGETRGAPLGRVPMWKLDPDQLEAHRKLAIEMIHANAERLDDPKRREGAESLCRLLGLDLEAILAARLGGCT